MWLLQFFFFSFVGRCYLQHGWISGIYYERYKAGQSVQWCRYSSLTAHAISMYHLIPFDWFKTDKSIFRSLSLLFFSLWWCQIFTSRMSCSTTTSQPEWLQTSWGKHPTETSELFIVAYLHLEKEHDLMGTPSHCTDSTKYCCHPQMFPGNQLLSTEPILVFN